MAKVEIDITANDKTAGVFSNISRSFGDMVSVAGGTIISNVFMGITSAVSSAATAIIGFGQESIMAAGRVSEMSVVLDVLAKNAGMSTEFVKAQALAIKGMGIETAAAQEITALFIQNQLNLGQATDLARVAQDAAVISGKNSTETTNGLINGIVTLQTEVLRSNGITLDLAAAYDTYAASIGKGAEDLTTQEKQQAALNGVIEAGAKITGAYGAAMETAGKQIRSWPRYMNDIMVSAGTPFQEAFNTSAGAVSEFLKKIGVGFAESGAFAPVMERLGTLAGELATKFSDWLGSVDLDAVAAKIVSIVDGLVGFVSSFTQSGGSIGGVLESITSKFSAFEPLMTLFSGLGGVLFQSLLPAIIQIGTSLAPIVSEIFPVLIEMLSGVAMTVLDALLPPLLSLIETVLPPLLSLIAPLIELFGSLAEALAPIVGVILGALAELILQVITAIMPLIETLLPVLTDLFTTVAEAIVPLLEAILPPLISIVMMVIDAFMPLIIAILPVVADLFTVLILAITPILEAVLPVLISLIELVITALTPMIQNALPALTILFDGFHKVLTESVIPTLKNFSGWIDEHVTPAINGIISAIQNAIQWVKDFAASLSNVELPDWLTPGSPTPFEMGLRGISAAMKDLTNGSLGDFSAQLSVLGPGNGSIVPPPNGNAPAGASVVFNYAPTFSFASEVEARDKLLPFVFDGIRKAKADGLIY